MSKKLKIIFSIAIISAIIAVTWFSFPQYKAICRSGEIWNGKQCASSAIIKKNCESLPKVKKDLCEKIITKRHEMFSVYSKAKRLSDFEQKYLASRIYTYSMEVPTSLKHYNFNANKICKLRDSGFVHCVKLDSLLAFYTTKLDKAILSDISLLYLTDDELNVEHDTLIDCGEGVWGTANVSTTTDDQVESISENDESVIGKLCKGLSRIDATAASVRDAGMSDGIIGISGVTGIDHFSGYCGLEITSETDAQEFIQKTIDYLEEMRAQCEATLQSSVMEGEGESDLPGSSDDKKMETATEITQNGDGTETVTTVDSDGNMVTETRQSTQDHDSLEITYDDGSSAKREISSTPDGDVVVKDTITDPNVGTTLDTTVYHPDGSADQTTIGPNMEVDEVHHPALEPPPDPMKLAPIPKDCSLVDEAACSNCERFLDQDPRLETACHGSDLGLCMEYGEKAACCSNPDAFPADPRLVIPNPMGDFFCAGGEDIDTEDELCRSKCSIAYTDDKDCYSNCMSKTNEQFDWSIMDAVCLYAEGDWCFGTPGGIEWPVVGEWGGDSPLPLPHEVDPSMTF